MKWIALICMPLLLTSCFSYHITQEEHRNYEYHGERPYAYVFNPKLRKEYRILRKSGIYTLTKDSLQPNCLKVVLRPLEYGFSCGMGILPFLGTFGVLPGWVDNNCTYQFSVLKGDELQRHVYFLSLYKRFWWPDLVLFRQGFAKPAGTVLRAKYDKKEMKPIGPYGW